MMQHASAGLRNATRKGSNNLLHHGGHNGTGSTTNPSCKSIHTINLLPNGSHAFRPPLPPRNPSYQLFSASKNILQRFFTLLTAPGLRAPVAFSPQSYGARSLHATALRSQTIQSGLSLPVRNSLRNYALQRQANTFLPRGPMSAPPRCGGIAQVGLGVARNFSTARPIFEHLAQNVPIVARALYEADISTGEKKNMTRVKAKARLTRTRARRQSKPMTRERVQKIQAGDIEQVSTDATAEDDDIMHYFTTEPTLVTTYLTIPLAPPSSRVPLPLDPVSVPITNISGPGLLPPLSFLASLHASHSTHALRVHTLFARLDQVNAWSRGARCHSYSEGIHHQREGSKSSLTARESEGACTTLIIEFKGWSKNEVCSAIGESGTGWCTLQEVSPSNSFFGDSFQDCDSLQSSMLSDSKTSAFRMPFDGGGSLSVDPAASMIFPSIDLSASGVLSSPAAAASFSYAQRGHEVSHIGLELDDDPWADEHLSELSSPTSFSSDFSDLNDDLSALNGWDEVV